MISQEACQYVAVFIPIDQLGSILRSQLYRIVLGGMVIVLDIVTLVGAYVIIVMSLSMGFVRGGIFARSVTFFRFLAYIGFHLQNQRKPLKSGTDDGRREWFDTEKNR